MSVEQYLIDAYDTNGPQGVFDWVKANHPEWGWSTCVPCEESTPTWDGVCASCWTEKETA